MVSTACISRRLGRGSCRPAYPALTEPGLWDRLREAAPVPIDTREMAGATSPSIGRSTRETLDRDGRGRGIAERVRPTGRRSKSHAP